MATIADITAAQLRAILDYDPETGVFRWKARTSDMFVPGKRSVEWQCRSWNARYEREIAGFKDRKGYCRIRINNGSTYGSHRLAWLYMTGEWPAHEIDHIDLDSSNNIFSNLREATHSENSFNRRKRSDSTSSKKGIRWRRRMKKWMASIMVDGKSHHLGYFDEDKLDEAAAAYADAARELHGEFARSE
jgi:hypothetical protein